MNQICPNHFSAESAGLEPGTLNHVVVQVMNEVAIDISAKTTQGVFELFKAGRIFGHVIIVCDEANAERCPVFPGFAARHAWSFPDLSVVTGSADEQLEKVRAIRDLIAAKVREWCDKMCQTLEQTSEVRG